MGNQTHFPIPGTKPINVTELQKQESVPKTDVYTYGQGGLLKGKLVVHQLQGGPRREVIDTKTVKGESAPSAPWPQAWT